MLLPVNQTCFDKLFMCNKGHRPLAHYLHDRDGSNGPCRRELAYPRGMPPPVGAVTVTALGVDIELRCEDDDVARAVAEAWSDARSTGHSGPTSVLSIGASASSDVSGANIAEILHRLSPAVTLAALEARAGELVMLHAAALADPETGATAVLVAPSGTGKTTAASTLGRHFAYLSDETSGIAADGTLVPHRKPLSIIRTPHIKDQVSPTALGLRTIDRKCHLAALLVIERDPTHEGPPLVTTLETIDALALITPQASSLGRLDRPLHRLVDLFDRVGGVRHVTYSEATTLEPVVSDLLGGGAK